MATIITGVVSSIFASFIFILFLRSLRPKIIISPKISKWHTLDGKRIYQIKVINKTGRSIMNIKAQFFLVVRRAKPNGTTLAKEKIPLYNSEVMDLSKFDRKDKEDDKYAFRFGTFEDIEKLLDTNQKNPFFRFIIYGTDSFSGFGAVFVQDYPVVS